jgi:DNA-binding CsgD family transcriptional regulator
VSPLRHAPHTTGTAPAGELLERSHEVAALSRAVREVAGGNSAAVAVAGRPGTGRTAVLAEAAALARRAGLHVVTAPARPAGTRRRRNVTAHAWTEAARSGPATPLAVLVDDAQDGDAPEPQFISSLTRGPGGPRPLLWVAAGTDPAALDAGRLPRHDITLRPLSADAVRTLLTEAYGQSAAPLVPAALAATGGNPAVLREVLRRWPAPAPDPGELAALADQVGRHHLRTTLAGLPEPTAALVTASAVTNGDFAFDHVCELAGHTPPHPERARAALAGSGLLDSVTLPRLHDTLLTERVLGLMDDARRRDLYVRAVRIALRERLPTRVLGRLAAHTRLTEPWVPAALYEAGRHARRTGDDAGAAAFLEQAVERGPSGHPPAEVLLELAAAQASLRPEASDRAFRRVLTETTGPDLSTARLLAADLLTLRGGSHAATTLASAAARATTPPAERRTLHALRDLARGTGPRPAEPDGDRPPPPRTTPPPHHHDDPLPHRPAEQPGSQTAPPPPDVVEAAAGAWHWCYAGQDIGTARRLAAVALAQAGVGLITPALAAARALVITEDTDLARDGLERIVAQARHHRVTPAIGQALLYQAELALRTGDLDESRSRLGEAAATLPRHLWHPRTLPRLTALEALLAMEAGRLDLAASILSRPLPPPHEYGLGRAHLLFAQGVLGLHTGHFAEATAHLRECGRILLSLGCANPAVLPWRSHLAMARATTDSDACARLLAEDLTAARAWSAPGIVGSVHLWTALTLPGPTALRHLRTAVRLLAGSTSRRHHARALAELAAALLDDGRPAEGRRLLDEAQAAGPTDGHWPIRRTEQIAARFADLPGASLARLSPSQLRVALLAAEGWPNRAIAEKVSVSLRTVELHLTHTYRALGITGRADLAAMLGRTGRGEHQGRHEHRVP